MTRKEFLTPNEVATLLMVSPVTVRQWAQKGLLAAGAQVLLKKPFSAADVLAECGFRNTTTASVSQS